MKKSLLLLMAVFTVGSMFAQDCLYPFFSEYVEGTANSKAIEIYNPTDQPLDLTDYMVVRYSNGSTSASSGYKTDLIGTIPPYGTFILVNGQTTSSSTSPACDPALQAMADQLDGEYPAPMYMNGNDAITLETTDGVVWDIFGKVGENPGTGWCDADSLNYITGAQYWWLAWTKDHTLRRKAEVLHGVFTNPGSVGAPEYFMVQVEWDTVPGYWSAADTAWISANIWDGLGSHECDCNDVGISTPQTTRVNEAFLFPNPATEGNILVKGTAIISSVEVFNAIGQPVLFKENDLVRGDLRIQLNNLNNGMYFVKVQFADGSYSLKKLIIK